MSSHPDLACALPRAAPSPRLIERRLGRFHGTVAPAVHALAYHHPRLADLALSFPALLFALAVPRCGFAPGPLIDCVVAGEPLGALAEAAAVPLWSRRLVPEAFVRPLPLLPDGPLLRRRIANHLPRSPRLAPAWLAMVAESATVADAALAVWVAREVVAGIEPDDRERLRLVALWAWASGRHDMPSGTAPATRWAPHMRYATALAAALDWRERIRLHLLLGGKPIADCWLEDREVDGFSFIALRTPEDVVEEGLAMRHCVGGYGVRLAMDHVRVWSVRKHGARVATLSVQAHRDGLPIAMTQLSGPANKPVPEDVVRAARRWWHGHDLESLERTPRFGPPQLDRQSWTRLWRPYWLQKRRIPHWLPLTPSLGCLNRL